MSKSSNYTLEQYYNFDIIDLGYADNDLQREWHLIKHNTKGYESSNSWNKLIKKFQFEEFYKTEIALWKENKDYKGLPLRSWLYMNRKKYINKGYGELTQDEIMRGFKISGIHIGNSFHSPLWIKQFCQDYKITAVYDFCGGWGHRMLGAAAANVKYIYNDINPTTMQNCVELAKYLDLSNICFNCKDSSSFTPFDNYDAVFTCPPYHNVEIYSKYGAENLSYEDFLDWWKKSVIVSCINKNSCKYFAFVINRTFEHDLKQICINLNLALVDEHLLGVTNYRNHFSRAQNSHKRYEKVLIFAKTNKN